MTAATYTGDHVGRETVRVATESLNAAELSRGEFAGRLFDVTGADPETAGALYDELTGDTHTPPATSDTGGLPEYSQLLREAQARAGRERWEPVEQSALRAVLNEYGVGHLLETGALDGADRWRVVDVSDDDEDPRRRWYYASGDEPRPDEFRQFHDLLTEAAPDGYEPHYFRCRRASKDPAIQFGSWKDDDAQLTVEEAVEWMQRGGNVGIAGRPDGPLVNVDIDDDEETTPEDVPASLRARSRSRTGWHTWYFDPAGDIPNIPTDEYGEIRTDWQYVVAPGSFVASTREDIPDGATDPGYYTVADAAPVAGIEYDDLPEVFLDAAEETQTAADRATSPDATASEHHHSGDELPGDLEAGQPQARDRSTGSAVFDIDADAVLSGTHDETDRFGSVFHDSTTGANMSVSGGKLHCWRHGVAHGGLQALAVLSDKTPHGCRELGAPHKNSGAGRNRLKGDWRLVWAAWHEAKRRGHIPDDDPLPYRALLGLAVEGGVVDSEDLVERESDDGGTYTAFPQGTYNEAIEHAAGLADVPLGRAPVDTRDSEADPVTALPFGALDALDPDERKRAVRRRGVDWPDTADAREQLRDTVFRELRAGNRTVIDAPTALGKSYTVATEPWLRRSSTTGDAPVVHLHATTDARDEAAAETRQSNATGAVLKGRKERCPLAAGDHDPPDDPAAEDAPDQVVTVDGVPAGEWFDRQCDEKGLPFSTAHAIAHERNDQGFEDLPCAGDGDCPAVAQWDGLPRTDDGEPAQDVIHATHEFAYVPSLRSHTNVVVDEQPDFTADLAQDQVRRMVTAFLQQAGAPVTTWEEFVTLARYDPSGATSDADAVQQAVDDALDTDPATEWYVDDPDAHALAPAVARAVWRALRHDDPDANGHRRARVLHDPPRFDSDNGGHYGGTWLSVVIDEENTVCRVRQTPDFSQTRALIGLDAHPSLPVWELNTDPDIDRVPVLDPAERRLWRRYERGLTVVQVGEATRPRSGPKAREWLNDQRVQAVLDALGDEFGQRFSTAITTRQIEPALRRLLADTLGSDPEALDDDQTLHYGEEKSRNPAPFENSRAGYVYGCMDPGDEFVLDTLAELGLDATPGTAETDAGETVREKGRTFDGTDADTAREVLASVRENHVAQAAGRYARSPDRADSGATVFVHTDAAPEGFVDIETPGVEWLATDLQREILTELSDRPTATTREIAEAVDCSRKHVWDTLAELADEGHVTRTDGTGEHGADEYRADGVVDALVSLGVDQTVTGPLLDSNRWSVTVSQPARSLPRSATGAVSKPTVQTDGGTDWSLSSRVVGTPDAEDGGG
jgi:hypothetical protein